MSLRPRLSAFARQRIKHLLSEGNSVTQVVTILGTEGIITTRQTVWRLDNHIKKHGHINPLPKSGRPTKLSAGDLEVIDNAMEHDDETTGKEIVALLEKNGISVSRRTAYRPVAVGGAKLRGGHVGVQLSMAEYSLIARNYM